MKNIHSGEAKRRSEIPKFLSNLTEVLCEKGLCRSNEQPRSSCKCNRAELIEVVNEMEKIIETTLLHILDTSEDAIL